MLIAPSLKRKVDQEREFSHRIDFLTLNFVQNPFQLIVERVTCFVFNLKSLNDQIFYRFNYENRRIERKGSEKKEEFSFFEVKDRNILSLWRRPFRQLATKMLQQDSGRFERVKFDFSNRHFSLFRKQNLRQDFRRLTTLELERHLDH